MNNGRSSEREKVLPSSTGLPGGGSSLLDAADTICEFAARLYVQRRSKHVEASECQAESERRKTFIRDVAENLYKKFDAQVDWLCSDPHKVCQLSEKLEACTAGRTAQSKVGSSLSKLQRFFKRAHTLNDGSDSSCQFNSSTIGEPAKGRTTIGRIQCSSNGPSSIDDTNSSSGNTGSSAYSGDAPRMSNSASAVTMQGDVALCVTNACDLPRTKRLKFEQFHAVLRRDEVRLQMLLEFFTPSTFASAASAQRSPKYGLLCCHIETLRRTTQYEPPKDQPALLIKTDTGVVYLVTADDSGAIGAWHNAIERCRQEASFQRSTRPSWRPLQEAKKSTRANHLISTAQQTPPWRVAAGVHHGHLSLKEQRSLSADSVATRPGIHRLTDEAATRQPLRLSRFGASDCQSPSLSSSSSDCLRPDNSDCAQHNLAFDAGSCAPPEELVRQPSQEAARTACTDNTRTRARTTLVAQPRSADLDLRKVAHRLEKLVGSASACSDDREPTDTNTSRPRARAQGPACDDAQLECVSRYVKEEVTRFAWFHDALSRQEAGRLVTSAPPPHDAVSAQPRNGVWLVRRSESIGGQIVLTFAWNGKPKHVRMQLDADGTCRVQLRPDIVEYPHVADALEHFATVGLDLSRTLADQPKQTATSSEFERQFGDFAFGLPAASPKRIVLGRFVADVSRFSQADRVSFGVMPVCGEAASDDLSASRTAITVVPAYIKKRLLSTTPNSPMAEEASNTHQANPPNPPATQEASSEPASARRTDEDTPCNSNTPGASPYGSKTGRALANSYMLS